MKPKSPLETNKTNDHAMQGRWQEMNRKQRRETMRKIQSEDLSLEVIHRNAAGIDIGNDRIRRPNTRQWIASRQSESRTASANHSRTSWFGSVLGECTGHEESARAKK